MLNSAELSSPSKKTTEENLHFAKSKLTEEHIKMAFNEITDERIGRLTGLVAHFVYWCIFGKVNQMPLDEYHLKQLFISIAQSHN